MSCTGAQYLQLTPTMFSIKLVFLHMIECTKMFMQMIPVSDSLKGHAIVVIRRTREAPDGLLLYPS